MAASRQRLKIQEQSVSRSADGRDPSVAPWLVLALIIEQPSHGYEIIKRYEQRFASLDRRSTPRLYGSIQQLSDTGMIEIVSTEHTRGFDRRTFRATRAGRAAYRRWIAQPFREASVESELRRPLFVRLRRGELWKVIQEYERRCTYEAASLGSARRSNAKHTSLEALVDDLTLDYQRRMVRARQRWAIQARKELAKHERRVKARRKPRSLWPVNTRGARRGSR